MNSAKAHAPYIVPLKYNWLTSFYDPLLRWTLREEKFKRQLIRQASIAPNHRVLKPGGALHVADWGKAQNLVMRGAFFLVQMLDGFATTTENVQGKLPKYFREAGFANVRETQRYMTVFGTLSLYAATRAG